LKSEEFGYLDKVMDYISQKRDNRDIIIGG